MEVKFGIHFPRNFDNEYTLFHITTEEGWHEFQRFVALSDSNSEAHAIKEGIFRMRSDRATWEGEYASIAVVSDDPTTPVQPQNFDFLVNHGSVFHCVSFWQGDC